MHGDASQPPQPCVEKRPAEQAVLGPKSNLPTQPPLGQHGDRKVPVAGVWIGHHEPLWTGQCGPNQGPPQQLQ